MTTMTRSDFDSVVASVKQFESGWLRDLQTIVSVELKARESQKIQKARLEIQRIAAGVNMTIEQLLRTANKDGTLRKNSPLKGLNVSEPTYSHPTDPSLTWTGRGPTPKWISQSGKPKEEFLIAKAAS